MGPVAISVLTDEPYFQGSLDYLRQVRAAVGLPVLRKDFILDPYQVLEARAAGADAVLLIAECLDDELAGRLHDAIVALGMTPLVELYEPGNLPRVLAVGARLIGINNRDLRTFQTDLEHTLRLRAADSGRLRGGGRERHPHPPTTCGGWPRPASTPCWSARASWPTATSAPRSTNCWASARLGRRSGAYGCRVRISHFWEH